MTSEFTDKVYDILVSIGGAPEKERGSFIYHHSGSSYVVTEWRFQGNFGFGGKYRSETNTIDYYSEDTTEERDKLMIEINYQLSNIMK